METFTKLFGSITGSSVWLEDDRTRIVWITMLAMADRDGYVGASVGGLAHIARVPREAVELALAKFLAPDADSRNPAHEGRRIELAPRGWRLLNHGQYRDQRDSEARREYFREQKRKSRLRGQGHVAGQSRHSTHADTDTEQRPLPAELSSTVRQERDGAAHDERGTYWYDVVTGKGGSP
jgi:hypothetical protein